MCKASIYHEIINVGKLDPTALLLDLGCCRKFVFVFSLKLVLSNRFLSSVGTDLRKAVFDGFPSEQAFGCDLLAAFLELGHKLWNDKETCRIKFIADNVFCLPDPKDTKADSHREPTPLPEVKKLYDLIGRVRFLYTKHVFHLWNQEKQAEMALKLASLISRTPGSIIFGSHIGANEMGFVKLGGPFEG